MSIDSMCKGLKRLGCNVAAMCSLQKDGWFFYKSRFKSKFRSECFSRDNVLGYTVYRSWLSIDSCKSICDHFKPDVVVVAGAAPDSYHLASWISELKIPLVYEAHDCFFDLHGGDLSNLNAEFSSVSLFVARKLSLKVGKDVKVIYPPIDFSIYRKTGEKKTALLINPDPMKGGEVFLSLATQRPDVLFVVQECWPSNSKLFKLKEIANRSGNVLWRSPVANMADIYANAKILLVPSQCEEAFARVVIEAQCNGIPVLGSDRGGVPEAIGMGGLVLRADSSEADWLQAFSSIIDDPYNYQKLSGLALDNCERNQFRFDEIILARLRQCQEAISNNKIID